MSLRFRNSRLVHRNGLLVPACNACPPCIFIPPDPCDESEIQFGINESGTLSIDETIVWGGNTNESTFRSAGRGFRVHYPSLPTIRFRVEIDIIDITSSVSGTNTMVGQLLLNHSPFTEPFNLARPDNGGFQTRFAGLSVIKNFNAQPTDRSITYLPPILESEIKVLSVLETSPTQGTATIERKIWSHTLTQGPPNHHQIAVLNEPTITTVDLSYSCNSSFSFNATLWASVVRATGPGIPPTIEPYLRGDLHWEVQVTY